MHRALSGNCPVVPEMNISRLTSSTISRIRFVDGAGSGKIEIHRFRGHTKPISSGCRNFPAQLRGSMCAANGKCVIFESETLFEAVQAPNSTSYDDMIDFVFFMPHLKSAVLKSAKFRSPELRKWESSRYSNSCYSTKTNERNSKSLFKQSSRETHATTRRTRARMRVATRLINSQAD